MKLIDSKTCASRLVVRDLAAQVKAGELSCTTLLRSYRRRRLDWTSLDQLRVDPGSILLKSLHSILQVGVYFTCGGKVAVFYRAPRQPDGSPRVTGGFSVLKSWSPKSLHPEAMATAMARRVYLPPGPALKWHERGLASVDLVDRQSALAPHYLFLLYEIPLPEPHCLDANPIGLQPSKQPDLFVGWFDPAEYRGGGFDREFFDPLERIRVPVALAGGVGRLLLTALRNQDGQELEETSRGLTRYNPKCRLRMDADSADFLPGEVELDGHMTELLNQVDSFRPQEDAARLTLADVLMLEPNFNGVGIKGPAFIRWLRQRFAAAS
ncbi:MAG: hypothetical protein Q7P63_08650 [Verrucomicrobiota bacterium JB022]|nr:hypothetical protein [Verrucomicrobiota bacterium JB022]